MTVTPSGNKRQMENQRYHYEFDSHDFVSDIFQKVAATLDLAPDDAATQFTAPEMNNQTPAYNQELTDTMNDSNQLPSPEQSKNQFMLDEYDPNNKTHKALLNALTEISRQSGLVSPGVFKHKVNAEANSITITFVKVHEGGEKLVEKP